MTGAGCRRQAAGAGFTLIEGVVAAMVIAILVAIAIPAFRGFSRSAQDQTAQEEIALVLASERAFRLEEGTYTAAAEVIMTLDPAARLHPSDPQAGVTVTLNAGPDVLCLERTSLSGVTFGVWESADEGAFYGRGGGLTGACPDTAPAGYTAGGW